MNEATTARWIRNKADELAAENGCEFDERRGSHAVFWVERYCRLYEGDAYAGLPMLLRGCAECDYELPRVEEWNEEGIAIALDRATRHAACVKAGHRTDWQYDTTMRLFGWSRESERWKRRIRRFNAASVWVPKKNKKSPTMAAWGLYLLVGDGEQGQKVFFGAKDGSQAREISGKHAIEMCRQSEEMMAECKINLSLMQIEHRPSKSILKPLSSGDATTQKAKEGINGSVLIDETHVVDDAFMRRISRAGISRTEPLQIEVSTAGNDPESYGRKRYEYGKQVAAGEVVDERLLFVAYEAPQELSDEELAADPVKYGKMANPAWGHTVNEEEFLDDFNRSKASVADLADFKMYRLDIWQASENPWLNMGDWSKCRRDYTEADLEGRDCYVGLDLSKSIDTTALALVFPDGGETEENQTYRQWVYYFLPEDTARKLAHKVRYQQWARDGWITLTEGSEVDYSFVRAKLNEVRERFNVKRVFFDNWYATQLVQRLIQEDGWASWLFEPFKQAIGSLANPTARYESMVIGERLYHPGSPVLTWQVGHTKTKPDMNNNRRPVKQKSTDHRTIDGVVAGIMGLAAALAYPLPTPGKFYESNELEMSA